ncbi:MAG: sugar ABC transporter ATP-binding protein [Planctomycetota bacterium]|jgi:ABC-type sugar transport system ATPase subunit
MSRALLEMRGISKAFPGVRALSRVDFSVGPREIVGLVGENGAGKSTLMKVLTGVYRADEGDIVFLGREARFRNTREAYAQGISIVFQEFNLCPNLSAMENLFLGSEVLNRFGLVSYSTMRAMAEAAFGNLKIDIGPAALVRNLGVAQQQMIEVAKALSHDTKILIMDEPTSVLTDKEIGNLFAIMRDLVRQGISIVFISHKLKEGLAITDRVVCLRDGEKSGEAVTKSVSEDDLVSMMVGRELDRMYTRRRRDPSGHVVLDVQNLSGSSMVDNVSFQVRRGEVVGLAGLIGAGRTELARLIVGAEQKTEGTVALNGAPVAIRSPADAVRMGIGYVPEDRKRYGLVLPMTVRENITMAVHGRIVNAAGLISSAKENAIADDYVGKLRIRVSSREQVAVNLSGGNQQKLVIGKWLATRPLLLILDEPTRGIDVGAKAEVHRIIAELADDGVAVLVISSELPEILHVSDRILVMHEGRLTADIPKAEADEESVMRAAVA